MQYLDLTHDELDALREVSSIGMAHAATALSQLIGRVISLQVPNILLKEIRKVPDCFGGPEKLVVGIYLQILGDARGNILLVFPRESAFRLLADLLRQPAPKSMILDDLQVSALKEVGNILAAAYLNALGGMVGMTFIPSVPMLSYDMAGAVVDYVLVELGAVGDYSLMVETHFQCEGSKVSGHFFVLPDPQSLDIIMRGVHAARP